MDELAEISFIVANQQSVLLTSANSAYLYRYSPVAPYCRLGTISIGPFVNKGTDLYFIIRNQKLIVNLTPFFHRYCQLWP